MIRSILPATALLLASAVVPLRAQTVDYTAFEQMFGEPVTTSATGKPQRVSEVPASMDILTADDIRRSGANNLPDILRFVAGIDVRRYGMQDAPVGIRGYNTAINPRLMVLLDGRQVYQDDYGFTAWSLVPVALSAIRQIEIIKGPNSALYGFNAVSGVINIVTYDPLRDRVNAARVDGGSQSLAYGEFVSTIQIPGRLGVRLSATGVRSSEFQGDASLGVREQPHSGTVAADVRVQLAPGVQWDVSASIGSLDGDLYGEGVGYLPNGQKANSLRSRLSADTAAGTMELDVYRNNNSMTLGVSPYDARFRQGVTVVRASDLLKLGTDHTLRVAAEYRDNSASSPDIFHGSIGYSILSGSLMWDWQISPRLSLTNALRLDHLSLSHQGSQFEIPTVGDVYHDRRIIVPSFNSGAVLKLTELDTVRFIAARAIQLPSLIDFGFAKDFGGTLVTGNSGLQASAVQNYEFDYDRRVASLGSTLRLAAFAQHTDNTIGAPFGSGYVLLPTGQALLRAENFGSSSALGGEIGLKGSSASGLRWNVSYALAAVRDSTLQSRLSSAPSVSYQRQTPTHAVLLGAGYTWGRLETDVQARWQSHIQDFAVDLLTSTVQPVTVPNYVTLNARIGYRVTEHATLSLVGEQLNRRSIAETAGRSVNRRLFGSLQVQF